MVIDSAPAATAGTAGELVRPLWRRWRFWSAVALVVVLAALLVGLLGDQPGRPLDPASAHPDGSKALARLLAGYGTTVSAGTELDDLRGTVLVTAPDDYSTDQLRRLAADSDRLVLVRPGVRATRAVAPSLAPDPNGGVETAPSCRAAGARAAGIVDLPADAVPYGGGGGGQACFGGALIVSPTLVIIGSAQALQNDTLDHRGIAAFDINAITADRTVEHVRWLLPGAAAQGPGPASLWDLFPPGAHRAALWLLVVGVLVVLWRARRLGAVVRERLPVVVRSSEIVEGHGRLYERAAARDRAAQALRAATTARLAARQAMPRDASPTQVAAALAATHDRAPGEIWSLLAGPPPSDDAQLTALATELDRLEATTITHPSTGHPT